MMVTSPKCWTGVVYLTFKAEFLPGVEESDDYDDDEEDDEQRDDDTYYCQHGERV